MKLEKIKLSGFKSFVDTTIIPIGRTITAIVGPNGCGKSNIIDAVRWVMGESSAKHLRGGSMTDVIFNGCATRKPVGLATVELIFDNSAEKIGGEYAQYAKISLKRQVSRDGQSAYFLNGSRCRRKDITDLFLGTGLGARSYAIIEQGTISRMIEAKPEELRLHIEEAAGISKYKERRQETQAHISHTQENLQRLLDLRTEVATQVKQLQKQAEKAQSYVSLKQQQRQLHAELLAMRWQTHQQIALELNDILQVTTVAYQQIGDEQKKQTQVLEQQQAAQKQLQQQRDETQALVYQASLELTQLEQAQQHQQQNQQQLGLEIARLEQQLIFDATDYQQELAQLMQLQQQQQETQQQLQEMQDRLQLAQQRQQESQQQQTAWQQEWNSYQTEKAKQQTQLQVQDSTISQLQQQSEQLQQRLNKAQQESTTLSNDALSIEIAALEERLELLHSQQEKTTEQVLSLQATTQQQFFLIKQLQSQLHDFRSQQQAITGKITALELLQQHALGKDKKPLQAWLKQQGLENQPPLAQFLRVETGWEHAVEIVLSDYLSATCVDSLAALTEQVSSLQEESLTLFETQPAHDSPTALSLPKLSDKVNSCWDLTPLLAGIYCVESLSRAQQLRRQLKARESIMTQTGVWLGANWLKICHSDKRNTGILQREQQLRELKQQQQAICEQLDSVEEQIDTVEIQHNAGQAQLEQARKAEKNASTEIAKQQTTLHLLCNKQQQHARRQTQLLAEMNELQQLMVENTTQLTKANLLKQQALVENEPLAQQKTRLEKNYTELQTLQKQYNQAVDAAKQAFHSQQTRLETLRNDEKNSQRQIERLQQQQARTTERVTDFQQKQQLGQVTLKQLAMDLAQKQVQLHSLTSTLQQQQLQFDTLNAEIALIHQQVSRTQQVLETTQQQLEKSRFAQQENQIRQQTLTEQLAEIESDVDVILKNLSAHANETAWKKNSEQVTKALEQLGSVNLTAIDEHKIQFERLAFLDAQQQDLTDALDILAQAIAKIDKETRLRFKETFDKINTGLQEKFPKLFGGGQAYLELTQQNLLESGVNIIARPPGKKNSSIAMLSGGEKALTAVALVFSIFELNPAPFCLLDEVDAPLDDTNVGRFSKMVEEMSATVQFLFISHNKVTMEIAQQLTGVTMQEAGVSRMVAVNIEDAVQLAEG